MSKSSFVDFKSVKAAITMEQLLEHYGLLGQFKRSKDNLSGPCPIHKGSNSTQFRVSVSKSIWNCFSECKGGGNVLDFVARMEGVSIHAAALKIIEWFGLDSETVSDTETDDAPATKVRRAESKKPVSSREPEITANKPLKFRLEKLERQHPYLNERGLSHQTIIDFGIGFCSKGMMAGRIAIPIHTAEGEVVAYVGRWPGEPPEGTPKYKLPPGFRKSLELFNVDRAFKEEPRHPLVIVEGFFGCMALHQHGVRKVVALMGSTLSISQEEILRRHLAPDSRVILMLDGDDAGRAGSEDIAIRLSRDCFVRVHQFEQPNMQPEDLPPTEIPTLLA